MKNFRKYIFATVFFCQFSWSENTTPPNSANKATFNSNHKIKMTKIWLAQKRIGSQKFVIETDSEEATGTLSWDLDKNYWKFEYKNGLIWEIYDEKLAKTENGEKKFYSCLGFAAFLKHPVEKWDEILDFESEETELPNHVLLVKFQQKTMIWKYKENPFELLAVGIQDSHDRYYLINFETSGT